MSKMINKFYLKSHEIFAQRITLLKEHIQKLRHALPKEEYSQHETVKLAARIRNATLEVIPQDPNRADYLLTGELKKYRRYKQGLQRYRIIFCFSSKPGLIIYLYVNDRDHLRQQGGKNDPYEEFKKILRSGKFSHDPKDPRIQKWLQNYH